MNNASAPASWPPAMCISNKYVSPGVITLFELLHLAFYCTLHNDYSYLYDTYEPLLHCLVVSVSFYVPDWDLYSFVQCMIVCFICVDDHIFIIICSLKDSVKDL